MHNYVLLHNYVLDNDVLPYRDSDSFEELLADYDTAAGANENPNVAHYGMSYYATLPDLEVIDSIEGISHTRELLRQKVYSMDLRRPANNIARNVARQIVSKDGTIVPHQYIHPM